MIFSFKSTAKQTVLKKFLCFTSGIKKNAMQKNFKLIHKSKLMAAELMEDGCIKNLLI